MSAETETATHFSFNGFTVDVQRRGLYRNNVRIHLTPKPLEVLIYLLRNRGRLVEKRELLDAVWGGVFVTEDNLVQAIKEIRRALGDQKHDPRFIQTVPRQGYRFIAVATSENARPQVSFVHNGDVPILEESRARDFSRARILPAAGIFGLAILVFGGLSVYLVSRGRLGTKTSASFEKIEVTRVTTSGKVTSTAMSADGKYVVFAVSNEGHETLWLKQATAASEVRITEPSEVHYQALTFSPDTAFIYYVVRNESNLGQLYQIPLFGGVAKKLIADIDSTITFSADGKHICFFRGYPEKGESKLVIANADGTQQNEIVTRSRPDYFPTMLDAAPSWSPVNSVIACPAGSANSTDGRMTVIAVPANGGAIMPITARRWWQVGHLAWLRDGSGLIMTAKEHSSDPSQIWHISYPKGEARRITADLNDYLGVSLTHENPPSLLTVQANALSSISIAPDQSNPLNIPISSIDGGPGMAWTPDGRIVYTARLKGNQDIYLMDADGGNRKQLTADAGDNTWPSASADGRYVVFMSTRSGATAIWRMNLDGSDPKQLTNDKDARWPRCTPDSTSVVYVSLSNPSGLFKVSIEGGEPVQLTNKRSKYPAISPDGKLIATVYHEEPEADKTAIYLAKGGSLLRIVNLSSFYFLWTPDGSGLAYTDQYSRNIFNQSLTGGKPRQLTHFTDGQIRGFDWSRSGRLACSRRVPIADAVILRSVE